MSTCNCGAGKPLEMPASIKSTPAPFVPSNKDYTQLYDKLFSNKYENKSPLYYMIFGGVIVTLFFLIKR